MPGRLRLYDLMNSRLPNLLGLCADNTRDVAAYVNSAQEQLLYAKEAGEEGWVGTFAEIAFTVSRAEPCITLPRDIARLEAVNVCDETIALNNPFIQYMQFGNGRLPKNCLRCNDWFETQGIMRNNAVLTRELSTPPQFIRVYPASDLDANSRILIQGTDANDNVVYTQDGYSQVEGVFLNLIQPYVDTPMTFNRITGIQKDQTYGAVRIYQLDPTTADEVLLLKMGETEETASYRRYYFHNLPCSCCPPPATVGGCAANAGDTLTLRAIAKLDLVPVQVPTDYTLLQCKEAIILQCQAIRYQEMDSPAAKGLSVDAHRNAIRLLNGELNHFYGQQSPAINFKPFGSARLERQKIGTLV